MAWTSEEMALCITQELPVASCFQQPAVRS